ncbi:MAG: hypothetical protein J5931_07410 [Prevotella sp.]|nr:hypothetical protein [Prevotella sp.]
MAGQIATYVDSLHLSYEEVVYKIPLRVLQLMMRDKQHETVGTVVRRTSGRDMAARRKRNQQKQ